MFLISELGAANAPSRTVPTANASPRNKLNLKRGYILGLRTPKRPVNTAVEGTENHTVNRESWLNCRYVGIVVFNLSPAFAQQGH